MITLASSETAVAMSFFSSLTGGAEKSNDELAQQISELESELARSARVAHRCCSTGS